MGEERTGRGRVGFGCHLIWKWILGFLRKRQVEICFEQTCLEMSGEEVVEFERVLYYLLLYYYFIIFIILLFYFITFIIYTTGR